MRNRPFRIDAVTAEAAAEVIVDAALRHARERCPYDRQRFRVTRRPNARKQNSSSAGCGNLGAPPNPPWTGSKLRLSLGECNAGRAAR
jgi:hypothetical protein